MMKGGKEEDKIMGPMFPRLHVNDTDKGGPRAPPRNKMALYEQLSIPSQRFNSSTLPLPPQNARNLAPSASHGNGHERSVFSPFYEPPSTPAHLAEKVHSRSSDRENLKTTRIEFDHRFSRHVNYKSANAARSVAECSSLRPIDSSAKNSCRKRTDDEDDFRVPTYVNSKNASYSKNDTTVMETKRLTPFHANNPENGCSAKFNSSVIFPNYYDKPLEPTNTSDMKSGKNERSHSERKFSDTEAMEELKDKFISHLEAGEKLAEPSEFFKSYSDREHISTINVIEKTHPESCGIRQESCANGALDGPRCLNDIDIQNGNALRVRSESCSKASLGNSHRSPNTADKCNQERDGKASGSPASRDADRNDEVSETSMVDSISALDISPDDVVGVIGTRQFWMARRAIVNQQRVFAVQLFELHRLIKVQKLIAASPHLLQGNPCITPQKVPTKNLPAESNAKSQSQIVKQKDDSQKPNQNAECQTEKTGAPSPPPHDDGLNEGQGQPPRYVPYSGNPPQVHPTPDNRPSPWCFQPPPNQWLVPVMSPSEGLIYKPYTGPCPPAAGFMAPVYGNYSPMSLPPGYGVPSSHQQQNMGVLSGAPAIAPNYFPSPYGLPAVNPIISNSAVEQVSPMTGPRPNGQTQHSRSSCNMSFPKSDAFTGRPWKFRASKDSELQGSTASSPCERAQGEGRGALALFPMASAVEGSVRPSESNGNEHQTRVIKVVPHNARSATESAARIFRSIQGERQHFDS